MLRSHGSNNPTSTSVLDKNSWKPPVIVTSNQGQTSFQAKDQLWADNASSSPFFGHAYICANDFRAPTPMSVYHSDDGATWTKVQVTSAQTNVNPNTPNSFGYRLPSLRTRPRPTPSIRRTRLRGGGATSRHPAHTTVSF